MSIDIRAVLEKVLSHFEVVVAGSEVERCAVATLKVRTG